VSSLAIQDSRVLAEIFFFVCKQPKATPALMEMVTAEIFKTRIYPLPANGSRTLRICYETRVSVNETNHDYVQIIPGTIAKGIDSLNVRVHCLGLAEDCSPCEQIEGAENSFDFVWQTGTNGPGIG